MSRISVVETTPKFQLRYIVAITLLSCLALYFSRYALFGTKGFFELKKKEEKLATLLLDFENKKKENARLEGYVNRLSSKSLDLDFLDERARVVLGFVATDDTVLLENDQHTSHLENN